MLDLIKTLHSEFEFRLAQLDAGWIPRETVLPDDRDKVTVAIGMRRAGKSFTLFQTIKQLLAASVSMTQILYVDFEDDRLQPFDQKELANLLDDFYSLFPENHQKLCYLFLDEIHCVEDWPLVIRRYLNTKNVKIYLSGSSAKMLSKEIATELRGRALTVEIWPYSFNEYLLAKGEIRPNKTMSRMEEDHYCKLLSDYLTEGGFPEVVNKPKLRWSRILQDYVSVVTYRDIIERHNIENIALVKYMIHFLLTNAGTACSGNKMFNAFKSQGFHVGRSTVYDYLSYIEDAFLEFTIPVYSESVRKMQTNPKKLYAVDSGLVTAHQLALRLNYGRLFENLIYLDLRRRGDEIYYYLTDERYEVDFFTKSLDGQLHLYQVCWNMDQPKTLLREQRALEQVEKEFGIKGEIITQKTYFDWLQRA